MLSHIVRTLQRRRTLAILAMKNDLHGAPIPAHVWFPISMVMGLRYWFGPSGRWSSAMRVQRHVWRQQVVWPACEIRVHISCQCCRQSFSNSGRKQTQKVQSSRRNKHAPNIVHLERHLTKLNKFQIDSDWFELSKAVFVEYCTLMTPREIYEWRLNA